MNSSSNISPRLEGIKEQFERAKLFFNEAVRSSDKLDRFRRLVAAIYFARAVVELMLDAADADKQEVKIKRDVLEEILIKKLPRYMLLEKLRIHDFHRFGLLERNGIFIGGPLKLKARRGMVQLQEMTHGPIVTTTGNSRIEEQRVLRMKGDAVFDDEKGAYVSLQKVLSEYLAAVPEVIEEFRKLQMKKSG